jgi:hypothetical protein
LSFLRFLPWHSFCCVAYTFSLFVVRCILLCPDAVVARCRCPLPCCCGGGSPTCLAVFATGYQGASLFIFFAQLAANFT